jgi:peptide/nickel transport system substrate-binding protein
MTVHIGARVSAKASGGQVLVSSTVRDLLAGAGLKFADRGEHVLKGVDGRWRLYAVEPRDLEPPVDLPPLITATHTARPTPWWKRRRTIAAAVIAVAALTATVIAVAARNGDDTPTSVTAVAADSVAELDAADGRIMSTTQVGRRPVGLVATDTGVWVTNSVDRTLSGVATDEGKTSITNIAVGSGPSAVAEVGQVLWVANLDGHSISRVSPVTKTLAGEPVESGNGLSDIAYGAGSVWITNAIDGTVWKIDPTTGVPSDKIKVAPALSAVYADENSVWTVSESAGTLTQLDPRTAAIVRVVHVGNGARDVTVGGGAVWVANAFDGTVSRVDADDGRVGATIRVGAGPRALAFASGNLFVANESDGTLTVIDADDNSTHEIDLANAPMGLTAAGDRVWVSVRGGILRYRGGALRVGVPLLPDRPAPGVFDPPFSWSGFGFAVTTAAYDGLVAYQQVGGVQGGALAADLAEEILPPTDGGRTYTFRLRRNLRYSDGSRVHATDVRTSLERQFLGNAPGKYFFSSIAGADECSPKACDLSAGVVTDDAARTVTFHLRRPNPDFVYFLAIPLAAILPADTPPRNQGLTPIPGTGPYLLADAEGSSEAGSAVLTRNPNFHPRGTAAPDGYVDRIEISWGGTVDEHLAKVKAGVEDWTPYTENAKESLAQLAAEVPAQFHLFDRPAISFAILNPKTPPFDDVRVRRAVNFAVDRRALADAVAGSLGADVTCQILPKDVFGHVPYCPYTLHPDASGVWIGADLATARRLVVESGTQGQRVAITYQVYGSGAAAAPVLADTLRSLGYRVALDPLSGDDPFDPFALPGYQILLAGWLADNPSAADFFVPLLACPATFERVAGPAANQTNISHYCSRAVDADITAALALQQRNPLAAVDAWAAVDRQITDAAPWVTMATFRSATVVSPRVGNVLFNPVLGFLMTQMWLSDRR